MEVIIKMRKEWLDQIIKDGRVSKGELRSMRAEIDDTTIGLPTIDELRVLAQKVKEKLYPPPKVEETSPNSEDNNPYYGWIHFP